MPKSVIDIVVCIRKKVPALKIVIIYWGDKTYSHEEFPVPAKWMALIF